jgi:hypothetical protein
MKNLLVLSLVLFLSFETFSQVVSENEKIYNDVVNHRKHLTELLSQDKYSEITKKDLIVGDISVVNMYERIRMYGLIGDFSTFIPEYVAIYAGYYKETSEEMKELVSENTEYKYFEWIFDDEFDLKHREVFFANSDLIRNNIENSDLSDEDKAFVLGALLNDIATWDKCNLEVKNEVELIKIDFLSNYPNSIYKEYVDKAFYEKYVPGKWGFAAFAEGGIVIPDGQLAQYVTHGSNIEIGLALYYRRFVLTGMFGGGGGASIKNTFYKDVDWVEGDKIGYMGGSLTLGYEFLNKSVIHITPYAGIGGFGMSATSNAETDYYDDVENVVPKSPLIVGVRFDFVFTKDKCLKKYLIGEDVSRHKSIHRVLRLNIGFANPQYNKQVPELKGNMWYAKLGFGIFQNNPQK